MNKNIDTLIYAQTITDIEYSKGRLKTLPQKNNGSGDIRWIKSIIMPLYNEKGEKITDVMVHCDATKEKNYEQLSITDELTQLYNRRFFNDTLEREVKRAIRNKSLLALMILDIEYFKKYNDLYGHDTGDMLLRLVANTLKTSLHRAADFVFRLGGDEFAILLSDIHESNVQIIAETIREAVANLEIVKINPKIQNNITVSIGLLNVDFSEENVDEQGFYTMADNALYKAKASGRNQVSVYENTESNFY
jgi:diguanylate cyclase (GGDEF)-like protein